MRAYIVTLTTTARLRLRASIIAASRADACKIGHRAAIEAGYTPRGVSARALWRAPCHA